MDVEDLGKEVPPLMFLSFPSTKDPTYEDRYPGKTTCAIVTATPYKWFEQWKEEKALHRSQDYEDFKNSIGEKLWQEVYSVGGVGVVMMMGVVTLICVPWCLTILWCYLWLALHCSYSEFVNFFFHNTIAQVICNGEIVCVTFFCNE